MDTKLVRVKNFSEICHINNKQTINVMNNVNLTIAKIYNAIESEVGSGDTVFNELDGIINYDILAVPTTGREAHTAEIKIYDNGDYKSTLTIMLTRFKNGSVNFSYVTKGEEITNYDDVLTLVLRILD